ncbi:MAG: hypothetical protein JWR42_416 [Marmoricola sp.]|nr:hypothetical protein [Marmoricola sp.]
MRHHFVRVRATDDERTAPMPGDEVVPDPNVVMDRGFTVPGTPTQVWPWIAQLGKGRGRWYLPSSVERLLPRSGRALRHVDPRWQDLQPGDVVPDYGRDATFTVVRVEPPHVLVYWSQRGRMRLTWAITLTEDASGPSATRVRLRLRLAGVRRTWLAETGGGFFDLVTIAGMAAGLEERLSTAPGTG